MEVSQQAAARCREHIYSRLVQSRRAGLLGISRIKRAEMASASVEWAAQGYAIGKVGDSLRDHVRREFADQYGSIWTMILFAVVWELIKRYLFESK